MSGGDRKIGNNKRSASNVAYKAQDRLSKNRKRKAAKEDRIDGLNAQKENRVAALRRLGAVRRLERRIADGAKNLDGTLAKARAAYDRFL